MSSHHRTDLFFLVPIHYYFDSFNHKHQDNKTLTKFPYFKIPLTPTLSKIVECLPIQRRVGRVWLNALVLKTSKVLKPSGVRIPHPPPAFIKEVNFRQASSGEMLSILESEEII